MYSPQSCAGMISMNLKRTDLENFGLRSVLGCAVFLLLFFARIVSAQVLINEIQISPIGERFIELYNSGTSDIELTGWYIQRKTATGSSFSSLVTSTELKDKTIISNSYFLISRGQQGNSDIVIDNLTLTESNTIRLRDSKGVDIDQVELGVIDEEKSYQRISGSGWVVALPTPHTVNAISSGTSVTAQNTTTIPVANTNTPSTPTISQMTAQAGPQTRVVLAGVPIIFEGKVAGLENSFSTPTHTAWSFGDGASAEGNSVSHTYYYPGEYTAVLDVVSGSLTATDRMLVRVVLPTLSLSTGGDATRSFFTIQNHGGDELDISGWQVASTEDTFTFPKNTILGAKKSATFASEVTGLATPEGSVVELRFPNGSRVEIKNGIATTEVPTPKVEEKPKVMAVAQTRTASIPQQQEASAIATLPDTQTQTPPTQKEGSLWPWYIGAAFLGVFALGGIRLTREKEEHGIDSSPEANTDDFEIVEESDEDKKTDIF